LKDAVRTEAHLQVRDLDIRKDSAKDLVKQLKASGGFTAKKLGVAAEIMQKMLNDKKSLNFLSFPADIIATGTRGIIKDMVKRRWFDILVTTCGTLDQKLWKVLPRKLRS